VRLSRRCFGRVGKTIRQQERVTRNLERLEQRKVVRNGCGIDVASKELANDLMLKAAEKERVWWCWWW
jgi:hypothetical protein